ncbi:hypothetical protein O9K51_04712 [Purpureocillium lavendulum]|uniref:Uncharacterized protein n=1 Tax=Purpureocillium lavendulum TaxID=1247861 RepID=A0AB34FVR1_9HYPO|nr:hypothetical protein O9K51_04712 [Purpureocillium lavendulum]
MAHLLAADEAVDRHGNGPVNVLRRAVLGKAHPAKGLADADDGLEVADLWASDVLAQQLLRDLALPPGARAGGALRLRLRGRVVLDLHRVLRRDGGRLRHGVAAAVRADDEARQALVLGRLDRVAHDAEDVEARQDGLGQLDVSGKGNGGVVAAAHGVGGGDDAAAGLQGRDDAGLGDGDGLLLHGLVNRGAVLVIHLVELVNQAGAAIGQHEGAALERPLARQRVATDASRQTDGTGALARGEDGTVRRLLDVLEHLGLGRAGVAEQQDVDVAAHVVGALGGLGDAAKERQGDGGLDVGVAIDAGGDGVDELVDDVGVPRQLADLVLVLLGHAEAGELVVGLDDVVGLEDGGEDGEAVAVVELRVVVVAVDARHLDLLAGLGAVDEVPQEDDLALPGQAAGGDGAGRLLQGELLVVAVDRLLRVEGEGAARLAALAKGDFDLDVGLLLEGAERDAALGAVELDVLELREDAGAAGDDAADAYEAVEVRLAQLAEGVVDGEVEDADVDLGVDALVVGVVQQHHVHGHLVEELEHLGRGVGQEVGEDGLALREVLVRHLERLGVDLAERADAVAVDGGPRGVNVRRQERLELALDGPLHGRHRHPLGQVGRLDVAEGLEGQLLVHDVGVHDVVRVLVVVVAAATRLRRQVDVAVVVVAGQEGGRDALSAGDLPVAPVELGLELPPGAEVHVVVLPVVVEVGALVGVVLAGPVVGLEALAEQVDVVVGHLVNVVNVVLDLGLLLDLVVVLDAVGHVKRRGRRRRHGARTRADRRRGIVAGTRALPARARPGAPVGRGRVITKR